MASPLPPAAVRLPFHNAAPPMGRRVGDLLGGLTLHGDFRPASFRCTATGDAHGENGGISRGGIS